MPARAHRLPCRGRLLGRALFCTLITLAGFNPELFAQTVRVAAASDLQFVLPELAAQYERQSGAKLAITYGSSGNLFSQIQNGAPFDLFFSADVSYPDKLLAVHLADTGSIEVYAIGRLVVWLPPDSPLDSASGLKVLLDPRVQRIAVANPEHAPYGRAAVVALQHAGLYDQLKQKLVFGESISQAAQFVQSGSAQAALLALSLASSPALNSGKRWELPGDQYPPVEQAVVLLSASPNKAAANAFLAFLKTAMARSTFERYGFFLPPPATEEKHKL